MHAAWEAGKTAAFLTIEGGAALAGYITRVKNWQMTGPLHDAHLERRK